jgi:hypothetical protein
MEPPAVKPAAPHDELYALRVQHDSDVAALEAAADRIARLESEVAGLIVAARRDAHSTH